MTGTLLASPCASPLPPNVRRTDGGLRSVREAQVLDDGTDSDDSGPVFGGRSDDEGVIRTAVVSIRGIILYFYV